ncbi:hypothetical protein GALMADRAFT_1217043 [Galerina marginata CBS 339.88]|uniref:Uncharacterized protein n=1 Tax=Galerina marginata (strain CBS 339.88) TaxID=685588 RepID=A0A067SGH0_GALM3|nr:hypothetical protein GALMADRAFT_1217043 [Galerina marginata CBS 339.88]
MPPTRGVCLRCMFISQKHKNGSKRLTANQTSHPASSTAPPIPLASPSQDRRPAIRRSQLFTISCSSRCPHCQLLPPLSFVRSAAGAEAAGGNGMRVRVLQLEAWAKNDVPTYTPRSCDTDNDPDYPVAVGISIFLRPPALLIFAASWILSLGRVCQYPCVAVQEDAPRDASSITVKHRALREVEA